MAGTDRFEGKRWPDGEPGAGKIKRAAWRLNYQVGIMVQRNRYRAVRVTKGILYSMISQPFMVGLTILWARNAPKLHDPL